jgi:hypothetical protein
MPRITDSVKSAAFAEVPTGMRRARRFEFANAATELTYDADLSRSTHGRRFRQLVNSSAIRGLTGVAHVSRKSR